MSVGDRRRTSCQECGRLASEVGAISWSGNCIDCAKAKASRIIDSLATHTGADFAKWRSAHAAAVGAIFPNQERPPGVPHLSQRQQRNQRQSPRWKKIRDARLAYAAGECEVKLPGCVKMATAVHLNPALGGNHSVATLDDCRAVCVVCHGYIHARVSPQDTLDALDGEPDRI